MWTADAKTTVVVWTFATEENSELEVSFHQHQKLFHKSEVLTKEASCSITLDDDDGRHILEGEHLLAWLHVPLLSWPFQHHCQVQCCCHRDYKETPILCVIVRFGTFVQVHSIIPWCVHHFWCFCTLVVYKSNGVKIHNSRSTQDLRCTWTDWWKYSWQSCSGSQLVN